MKTALFLAHHLTLAAVATLISTFDALAAGPNTSNQAQANYVHEMAVCNNGQSNQSLENCRREAGAALTEAKRGQLSDVPDQYLSNALRRCESHAGDDRQACEARILAQGDITSGAQAGGILRKSVTVKPAQ